MQRISIKTSLDVETRLLCDTHAGNILTLLVVRLKENMDRGITKSYL